MKLLRFSLGDDAHVRTGVFHDGSVYETDGANALGIHRPEAVRLMAPVGNARSIRFFNAFAPRNGRPRFTFGNVSALVGPDTEINAPRDCAKLDFEMHVAAIVGVSDYSLSSREAEDAILGYTIVSCFASRDESDAGTSKERDFAISIGPFLVTPDELEDKLIDQSHGRRYNLNMKALVNDEVVLSSSLADMQFSFAELLSEASRGAPLSEGDIIASGCARGGSLMQVEREFLKPGDEVTLVVERLGTLTNRIA